MRQAVLRVVLFAVLLVSLCLSLPCRSIAHAEEQPRIVDMNERLAIAANVRECFLFTPTANNVYTIQSFGEGTAKATLYAQGHEDSLTEAEGFTIERRFVSGQPYVLTVETGAEPAYIEFMRSALGRCYERPIELEMHSAGYSKLIARAYDTHWYRFTAQENGIYTISTRSAIDMTGYLLDAEGNELIFADDLFAPYARDFHFQANLEAGKSYYLRIAAKGDEMGEYQLLISYRAANATVPRRVKLSQNTLIIQDGERHALSYALEPVSDEVAIRWISSDPNVVAVDMMGEVTAIAPGEAQIIAWADEGVYDACTVTVEPIKVQSLTIAEPTLALHEGQMEQIEYELLPRGASNQKVYFASDDEKVATVDADGWITAVAIGETTIHLATEDGNFIAKLALSVEEALPVYRALLLGEQQYIDRDKDRIGSINSTQGMADMLSALSFKNGQQYQVTMRVDSTRAEAIRRIRWTYRGARPTDVSLFYINCHGDYENGVAYLEFHDGSRLTAGQLERELRKIPGTVIVIIDCCQSGSFLSTDAKTLNDGILQAFGKGAATSFAMSKYRVITSTAIGQDSYRITYDEENNESAMSTLLSRALCEAGGWDLIKDRRISMKADLDKDRTVTLFEAYLYTGNSIRGHLQKAMERSGRYDQRQDVQVYPESAAFVLFERE